MTGDITPSVLFVAGGRTPDYQCDMVHHGLKSVLGSAVEETQHLWYMYDDLGMTRKSQLYGRGFTIYGRLPRSVRTIAKLGRAPDVLTAPLRSRERLERRARRFVLERPRLASGLRRKVERGAYDLVIFGSIQRCDDLLDTVLSVYPPDRVGFVDGEDDSTVRTELIGKGIYFKRELVAPTSGVLPINFAVPSELVVSDVPAKQKEWATVRPGEPQTYVFTDEAAYFADYRSSKYALTIKKSGWDCLRHYEILMNGCVPYFPELEQCPRGTMTAFPKDLVLAAKDRIAAGELTASEYEQLTQQLLSYTRSTLTTQALARYVLEQMGAAIPASP